MIDISYPRPGTVLLVSHDAGGAEILSCWQNEHDANALHVIEGPARRIFSQRRCNVSETSLDVGLDKADWVLTGTSWGSDIEKIAIRKARGSGKFCASFLDHWVNYAARFELHGRLALPDEIWVGDSDAFKLATEIFPETAILIQSNPYFESLRRTFQNAGSSRERRASQKGVALWVGENVTGAAMAVHHESRVRGYTQTEALDFFLSKLDAIDPGLYRLRIRPHPSEGPDPYERFLEERRIEIELVTNQVPLEQQILEVELVAGADSMGLAVAILAGKRTISAIPPGGAPRSIPWREIEDLIEIPRKSTFA